MLVCSWEESRYWSQSSALESMRRRAAVTFPFFQGMNSISMFREHCRKSPSAHLCVLPSKSLAFSRKQRLVHQPVLSSKFAWFKQCVFVTNVDQVTFFSLNLVTVGFLVQLQQSASHEMQSHVCIFLSLFFVSQSLCETLSEKQTPATDEQPFGKSSFPSHGRSGGKFLLWREMFYPDS